MISLAQPTTGSTRTRKEGGKVLLFASIDDKDARQILGPKKPAADVPTVEGDEKAKEWQLLRALHGGAAESEGRPAVSFE